MGISVSSMLRGLGYVFCVGMRVSLLIISSKTYGAVKAASMANQYMESWKRQTHPTTTIPHSTPAPPAISVQNRQRQSQFQVSKPEAVTMPPPPPPQTREWSSFAPVTSAHGRQTSSQHVPAAPSHAPLTHTPANELTTETNAVRLARSTGDVYNVSEAQSHHPEVTTSSHVVISTDRAPTVSAPPSSQSESILLASEEKGKTLYSLHGLAASIKRSLNAERLAASMEPPASSDPHSQEWKPLDSIEVVDTQHQTKPSTPDLAVGKSYDQDPDSKPGTQPVNLMTEPVDSPSTILPVSFSEGSVPHEETIRTVNEFQIPNSQHDPSPNFIPYSTLTGAVSFDKITDSVPLDPNPAPSSEATSVLEDTTTSQPTSQIVLHDDVEDPLIPEQSSFEPLSFPHRTPTPPLAATITTVHDESEVDEKADPTPSSRPSTPLHEIEIDSELRYIPSGNEDDVEMSSVPGEDLVPTQPNRAHSLPRGQPTILSLSHSGNAADVETSSVPGEDHVPAQPNKAHSLPRGQPTILSPFPRSAHNIASSELSQPGNNDTLMQGADVSTHQATSLNRSIEEIDRGSIGSLMVQEHPGNEGRRSAQAPEELAQVLLKTSPIRAQSTDFAETSSRGSLPKRPRKSRGKQKFYIAVPPASEWVLQAKHREAERKAVMKEKAGESEYLGILLCYFSRISGQHGNRGS